MGTYTSKYTGALVETGIDNAIKLSSTTINGTPVTIGSNISIPQGPQGEKGDKGDKGDPGASDADGVTYDATKQTHTAGSVGAELTQKANKPTSASAIPTTWQDNTNYSLGTVDGTLNIGNVAGSEEGIIIYFTAGTDFALNEGSTPLDWMDGEAPDAPEVGKSYMLTIYNGIYDLRKHGVPTT